MADSAACAAVAEDMGSTRANMARKSWFGEDLAAAAAAAEEEGEDARPCRPSMALSAQQLPASLTQTVCAAVAGDMGSTRANMARKSWFGKDLAAAAAAAEEEGEDAQASSAWYNTLMGAVRQTVVISEILDSRTRNLISVRAFAVSCMSLAEGL